MIFSIAILIKYVSVSGTYRLYFFLIGVTTFTESDALNTSSRIPAKIAKDKLV